MTRGVDYVNNVHITLNMVMKLYYFAYNVSFKSQRGWVVSVCGVCSENNTCFRLRDADSILIMHLFLSQEYCSEFRGWVGVMRTQSRGCLLGQGLTLRGP